MHKKDKCYNYDDSSSDSDPAEMNDKIANKIIALWKKYFPDVTVVTMPSKGDGVLTLVHGSNMPKMKINGLVSRSPLANSSLFSTEISRGKYINLYETMIPSIPGKNGERSTDQVYVNELYRLGLDVAGVHFHWMGATVFSNDKGVTAVHHQNEGMDPIEFSRATIKALLKVTKLLDERGVK